MLSDIGITISNEIFKAIVCRYAHDGVIVFDDFVLLLVRLITVFGKFKENLEDRESLKASFYVDEVSSSISFGMLIHLRPFGSIHPTTLPPC